MVLTSSMLHAQRRIITKSTKWQQMKYTAAIYRVSQKVSHVLIKITPDMSIVMEEK